MSEVAESGSENPPQTNPPTPVDTSGRDDGNQQGAGQGNSSGNNRNRNNRNRHVTYVSNHPKDWKGKTTDLELVLGIKPEKLTNQTSVDGLLEKLEGYAKKNFDHYEDVLCLIVENEDPMKKLEKEKESLVTDEQRKKVQAGDLFEQMLMKDAVTRYGTRKMTLQKNIGKVYELLWGQCTNSIKTLVKGETEHSEKRKKNDVSWLVGHLRQLTSGVDNEADSADIYFQALYKWTHIRQGENESDDLFQKRADTVTQNLILAGGEDVLYPRKLLPAGVADSNNPKSEEKEKTIDRIRAMHLLCRSDPKRQGTTVDELRKAKDVGRNEWPQTQPAAFKLIVKRSNLLQSTGKYNPNSNNRRNDRFRRGAQFLQGSASDSNELVPGTDGSVQPNRTCYHCGRRGHIRPVCPLASRGEFAYNFSQPLMKMISKHWILLDTCSTCCVTNNDALLENLHQCAPQDELQVITNGGGMRFKQKGKLKLLPLEVHYNVDSLATILSFKKVAGLPGVHVYYDNHVNDVFFLQLPNQFILKFKACEQGLYYLDTTNLNINDVFHNHHVNFLSTVAHNKEYFTKSEIQGAIKAREEQERFAWPSTETFKSYISKNLITNANITVDDINRAIAIFGKPEPLHKGTMTRQHPITHRIERVPLPLPISQHHKQVQLYVDFLFVNRIPFIYTISDKLKYRTIHMCKGRSFAVIKHTLDKVVNKYNKRGFEITAYHGDNEFDIEALHDHVEPAELHIYATNEHVGMAERGIRTTKERARCVCYSAPYRRYPKLMI